MLTASFARADGVPGTVSTDPFDSTRGTIILTNDAQMDPINAFRTNGGFQDGPADGHTLMRNGGLGSVSFIEFQTGCRASIEGVRLFAANDGAAFSFRRSLSRFQLWADLDDNGSFETLVVDTGTVTNDYSLQPGNASTNPTALDLTLTNIGGGVISAQHWRLETVQGSDVQPFEGARIIEVDALPPRISVTNTNDSGPGSLRQAILDANFYPCPDAITFDIPGPGPHVIQPLTPLPQVTDPVNLDARTQPGYAGLPLVELRGDAITNSAGLMITSSNCVVAGFAFTRFTNGPVALWLQGPSAAGNWILGNHLGLDPTGTNAAGNSEAMVLGGGAHHNVIGTDGDGTNDAAERNVISGNQYGFVMYDAHTNRIAGNYIGTDRTGTLARGNQDAFYIDGSSTGNFFGTDSSNDPFNANERNVISGNHDRGMILSGPNRVSGNYFGLDPSGTFAVPNQFGLQVTEVGSVIGSDGDGVRDDEERNIISGNSLAGMIVGGPSTRDVVIRGNYIGTDASGTLAVPNETGISLHNQPHHMLITENVISGNTFFGIIAGNGPHSNSITANFIGADATGTNALGNGEAGIYLVDGSSDNVIGGTSVADRNVISGNQGDGVVIDGEQSAANQILGNFIGTDITGTNRLGNDYAGVYVINAPNTMIGGTVAGARNIISGNRGNGVVLDGMNTTSSLVAGNFIGTDVTGTRDLGNVSVGVVLSETANNVIGGSSAAARNVISGNGTYGIYLIGSRCRSNVIAGNFIGTDLSGTVALGNANDGVISLSAGRNTFGLAVSGGGNLISGNGIGGISIVGPAADGSVIQNNFVGTDVSGGLGLGNGDNGVHIYDVPSNVVGGTSGSERNVIAGNGAVGVLIDGASATNNSILGNAIFANVGLGIDLGADGPTANDSSDSDSGPNNLQNYPVLTSVISDAYNDGTFIDVSLPGPTNGPYRIELFLNSTPDPSAYGEGRSHIFTEILPEGGTSFSIVLGEYRLPIGQWLTATATDPFGNTSEFSLARQVEGPPPFITDEPVGGAVACGSNFTLSVNADGVGPLAYQWYHDAVALADATNTTFSLVASPATAGDYTVVVSNPHGAVTSAVATLTFIDATPPVIVCASNIVVESGGAWNFTDPSASDDCHGTNVAIVVLSTVTNAAACPASFTVTRTWQATDPSTNSATCSQVATVRDRTDIACLHTLLDPTNYLPTDTTTLYRVQGIVTTHTNLTVPGNTYFHLQDATAGIAVFWAGAPGANNTPPVGALVEVVAPLTHFNGLLELRAESSNVAHRVTVLGTSNPLPAPQSLPFDPATQTNVAYMETVEGSYFTAVNVFLDVGTSSNFVANSLEQITNSIGQTFPMFINSHTDLPGQPKPLGPVTLYGVLGQFDTTSPRTSGYQFIVSRYADVTASPPSITSQPVSQSVLEGTNVTFSVMALGTEPLSYQWRYNAFVVDFESFPSGGPNGTVLLRNPAFSGSTISNLDVTPNISAVTNSFPPGHSSANVLKVVWSFAAAAVNPWVRLTTFNASSYPNPTIDFSQSIQFDIYADRAIRVGLGLRETGTAADIGFNGGTAGPIEFVGVTNKTGSTPNPTRLVPAGTWTTLQFDLPAEPVTAFTGNGILESTSGKGVLEHLAVVPDDGSGAYTIYLDNFNVSGQDIPGATNATLTLLNVQPADAGSYSVVVSNIAGDVTSSNALLTVLSPPAIVTHPQSQSVLAGTNVTFTVAATGTAPLAYQWLMDGTNLPGATNSTLTISNVQPANAGDYHAMVTNPYGAATSSAATLTVTESLALDCAPNRTVECGSAWDFDAPMASGGCGTVTVTVLNTTTNPLCGATFSATRTWQATDACTNTAQCSQTITVADTTPPSITCLPDMTFSCTNDVPHCPKTPTEFRFAGGQVDDSCNAIWFGCIESPFAGPPCNRTLTRTFIVADDCGNSNTCTQTITVRDMTPPVIACHSNLVVEAGMPWSFSVPTATDCAETSVAITIVSTLTNLQCGNTFIATRTWRATDGCSNSATCSQTVTVVDTTPPVVTCASNRIVECGMAWSFDPPTASDIADGTNVLITIVSTLTNGACGNTFTATRTWRATDSCSNSASCSQTVMVVDTTPPILGGLPANSAYQCMSDVPPLPSVSATDNCDTNVIITRVSTTNGTCPVIIVHTWTATDDCTNTATASRTNIVRDTIPPMLVGVPGNTNYQCLSSVPGPPFVLALDNCDTNVFVFLTSSNHGSCPTIITRTWTAIDDCTNFTSTTQTITVRDTVPPVLVGVPGNQSYQCLADVPAPPTVTATDNCSTGLVVTLSVVTNGFAPRIITRTWTTSDFCTNTASATQTITVNDTTPPVILCASNRFVECGTAWNFSAPAATDNCDGTNLVIQIDSTLTNALCGQTFSATRTWKAIDSHTNWAVCSQTVTVVDTTPPVITCIADKAIECGTAWTFDPPSATDICDGTNLTIVITATITNAQCGNTSTATRTWRAIDSCSNSASCSQTVTVVDTAPPVIACVPDKTIECGTAWAFDPPSATDICDGTNLVIVVTGTITNAQCGNTFTATRTWRATDSCSNSASCSQTVIVVDTTPPVITCAPPKTIECGTAWAFDPPSATDICAGTNFTITVTSTITNATCGNTFIATRTWQATDSCSNSASCSQTVMVMDTTPPVITCAPPKTIECGSAWAFDPPSATDICDGTNLTITVTSTITNATCGNTFIATRTWRATDSCSNSASCSQTVTVVDTTPPVITCASNRIVECGTPWNFNPTTATDICDGTNLTIVIVNTVTNPLVGQTFAATRTWRATDSCSNSSVCSQTVTIVDTTPPAIVCSTNITVECAGPPGTVVTYAASASDVCDTNVILVCTPPSGSTFTLGLTTVRCRATDDTGNTNGCAFTVAVIDTTPPTIVCPANIIAAEMPRDGGTAVVTFAAPVTGDICDNALAVACTPPSGTAFPVGFTTVTCAARDDSGNSNTCAFVIRVIPYRLSVTTVTTTADSGPGSLRQALLDANDGPGENLIEFSLPGAGPHRIELLSALPVVTSPVIIDGASQPGFSGSPLILIDGSAGGSPDGLVVLAGQSTIRSLAWHGFATALRLETNGNNIVQGNFIGLNASGVGAVGNSGNGIVVRSESNLIGGTTPGQGNVIALNAGSGIVLDSPSAISNVVRGNFIGLGSDGQTLIGNGVDGVTISGGASRSTIGGTAAGAANVIGASGRNGITIATGGAQNAIRGNQILANAALGIDLGPAGPTPNDPGDADASPNNLQNFPILSDAISADGVTTISGALNSTAGRIYQIDFFLNDAPDPSGFGEGEVYIGSTSAATGTAGNGSFSGAFLLTATHVQFITATATDPFGNTSEFSPPVQVRTPPVFEVQPVATNVPPGQPATFCAEATGTPPIYYQWRLNGQNIEGATNPCYTLTAAQAADGGTYDVVIHNELGARQTTQAPLTLPLTQLPSGDNFADAVPLSGTNGLVAWRNRNASREPGEPLHAGKPGGKSVWYKWTATKPGVTTVGTRGSTFDTLLAVYEGDSLTNLHSVAFDEDRGGFFTSGVRFNSIRDHVYYIAIDGFGGAEGEFVFGWSHEVSTRYLPHFDLQPVSQTVAPGADVRFSIIADRVCGWGHTGCPDATHFPDNQVPQLDYQWFYQGVAIPGATRTFLIVTNVQPENVGTYTIRVSTPYRTVESQDAILQINETGFEVQQVQATDKFLDAALFATPLRLGNSGGAAFAPPGGFTPAAVVRGYTSTQVFDTRNASTENGEEPICGVLGGRSEWITFIPEENGTLFINTDGSTYDTVMAVFVRNPTNSAQLLQVGCDNNSGLDQRDSSLNVPVNAGQTNYIVVDGVNSASGTLRMRFSLVTRATLASQGFTVQRAHMLRVNTHIGANFAIQFSTNLVNWTTISTVSNLPTSLLDFIDTGSIGAPRRFYRAQMLP